MITHPQVLESNAQIASSLPHNLVAVFVGATSGIGEAALKEFVRQARKPKCYLVGRSEQAAHRIIEECKTLNPDARIVFKRADLSLIKETDKLCEEIKRTESAINLLFLSSGAPLLDRSQTPEGLHTLTALIIYSRFRIIQLLLPLLQRSTCLSRVVNIGGGGGKEGTLYPSDFQALTVPLYAIRGHVATLISLGHEALAARAPDVSFVHVYPGAVNTPLFDRMPGIAGFVMRTIIKLMGRWILVPIQESGERNVFYSTSAAFPAGSAPGKNDGVSLIEGVSITRGTDGKVGSGTYSIDYDGTEAGKRVIDLLEKYRKEGMVETVWKQVQAEMERITGS